MKLALLVTPKTGSVATRLIFTFSIMNILLLDSDTNVNLTNRENFLPHIYIRNVGIHRLLHDIPSFLILFLARAVVFHIQPSAHLVDVKCICRS